MDHHRVIIILAQLLQIEINSNNSMKWVHRGNNNHRLRMARDQDQEETSRVCVFSLFKFTFHYF
jgi:hypothetical protein